MYRFDPRGEPPETAFRAIARDQLDEALGELAAAAREGRSPVHEARRRCKKLRALLRLVRPAFDDFGTEDVAVREAAQLLSHLRDAEVMRETIDGLAPRLSADLVAELLGRLAAEAPPGNADERLAQFRERLIAIRGRTEEWSLCESGWGALKGGFRRTWRSARKRLCAARRSGDATALHEWRKALKHHGFQLDLLKRAAPETIGAESGIVDGLASLLGRHHDLTMLERATREHPGRFGDTSTVTLLREAIDGAGREIAAEALETGRQVFAERSRARTRRFAKWWKDAA